MPTWGAGPPMLDRPPADAFWYVKARHVDSGVEIQRLFSNGATNKAEAESDMREYLQRMGRAVSGPDRWDVIEVARWP